MQLSDEESELFLRDLSLAVEEMYNDADSSQTNEKSDDEEMALALGDGTLASATTSDTAKVSPKKKVFISYSWDDDEHKTWVHKLAEDLSATFEVKIDVRQPLGTELNQFMESLIDDTDKVLITYSTDLDCRISIGIINCREWEPADLLIEFLTVSLECSCIP